MGNKECQGSKAMDSRVCQVSRVTASRACQGSKDMVSKVLGNKVCLVSTTHTACLGNRASINLNLG